MDAQKEVGPGISEVRHREILVLLGSATEHGNRGHWDSAVFDALKAAQIAEGYDSPAVILDVARALQRLHLFGRAWEMFRNANCKSWMATASEWDGRPFDGTLLIRTFDQPAGDLLRYARLIHHAARRAGKCIVLTDARFLALFQRSFPDIEARAEGPDTETAVAEARAVASVETLCSHFANDWAAIERSYVPLRPDPALTSVLRERYRAGHSRPIVGISWFSTNTQKDVPSLADWSAFIARSHGTFVCLQYGDIRADVARLRRAAGHRLIFDSSVDQMIDIDGFAAQVAAMDAVITIPHTSAHMAGALGVPTIVMLDDRFHLSWPQLQNATPWYPDAVMIRRQTRPWDVVLTEAYARLKQPDDKAAQMVAAASDAMLGGELRLGSGFLQAVKRRLHSLFR